MLSWHNNGCCSPNLSLQWPSVKRSINFIVGSRAIITVDSPNSAVQKEDPLFVPTAVDRPRPWSCRRNMKSRRVARGHRQNQLNPIRRSVAIMLLDWGEQGPQGGRAEQSRDDTSGHTMLTS